MFKSFCKDILERTETAISFIKHEGLQNEQWILDWIDKINKLSVEI